MKKNIVGAHVTVEATGIGNRKVFRCNLNDNRFLHNIVAMYEGIHNRFA